MIKGPRDSAVTGTAFRTAQPRRSINRKPGSVERYELGIYYLKLH